LLRGEPFLGIDGYQDAGGRPRQKNEVAMIVTQFGSGYVSYQQVKVTVDGLHVHWINKRRRNGLPVDLSQDPRHKQHFRFALKDEQ